MMFHVVNDEGVYDSATVSFKQTLRWQNDRVWRKSPGLPRASGICAGEKRLVVMSFKNVSIKKQFETGFENLKEEGKVAISARVLVYLPGGKNPGSYN